MDFEYVGSDREGRKIKAIMAAESIDAVASKLRSSGVRPLKIKAVSKNNWNNFWGLFEGQKKLPIRELIVFTRQLGTILRAGILLTEAIETIQEDLENKYFANVLKGILINIRSGATFSNALAYYPKIFSQYYIAIVRSGEEIGDLGATVTELATYMEAAEQMRLKLLGAIRYPMFLIGFVFCIVSAIVLFLIPRFKVIFEGAGVSLPLLTRVVVGISEFVLGNLPFIAIGIFVGTLLAWRALKIFKIRFIIDYWIFKVPIVGKIVRKALMARFCQTASMLLAGGVGIIAVLDLSKTVVNNLFIRHAFGEVRQSIVEGVALSDAMSVHSEIPRILVKMIAVGEKAGMVVDMMKRMGEYFDQEVEVFLNNLNALLEPIFIILIGAIVLVVTLALYLPIFQMSSAVH